MATPRQSCLIRANAALRHKDFDKAVELYKEALAQAAPPLRIPIRFNLELSLRHLQKKANSESIISANELRKKLKLIEEIEAIFPHFDPEYYLSKNPDIANSGIDPVEHYCNEGWQQMRDPHPSFSTHGYLKANPDVHQAGINPFLHWIRDGQLEGREGRPKLTIETPQPVARPGLFIAAEPSTPIEDPVDIIIPIFNAYDDVRECLDRLLRYTPYHHRVILIDDASTDPRIQHICTDFVTKRPTTIFIKQPSNQGFISTVNRGFTEAKGHVVLLNTDAFVPENWLERLIPPILFDKEVATVTPMTSNGEIANVPVICQAEALSTGVADQIDVIARGFDPIKTLIEMPTGVGFCMAMSRCWLAKVPSFDTSFGRGYGEEVDWCQRVRKLGGKHMLTGALFVEHRGGMSFGPEKQARIAANNGLISNRYPDYDRDVQRFVLEDPAIAPRLALGLALIGTESESVPVFLAHRLGGGAEIWLNGVIERRLKNNKSTVVIRDGDSKNTALLELHTLSGVTKGNISVHELEKYIKILPKKELIYSCLVASSNPLSLIDTSTKSLSKTEQFRILFHDFFPICPSYTLIGAEEKYCGIPSTSDCKICYQKIKEKTGNLSESIENWRARWRNLLERANELEVFSNSSKDIVLSVWPEFSEKIKIRPHQMNNLPRKIEKSDNSRIVIGVLGSIGYQKGAKVLHDLAEAAKDRFSIVVIGEIDPAFSHPGILVHGRFSREEIADLAERYAINRWFLPSIWPETFSFTTRECLATGLPVYAFDLGAPAEALQIHPNGRLIPVHFNTKEISEYICQR